MQPTRKSSGIHHACSIIALHREKGEARSDNLPLSRTLQKGSRHDHSGFGLAHVPNRSYRPWPSSRGQKNEWPTRRPSQQAAAGMQCKALRSRNVSQLQNLCPSARIHDYTICSANSHFNLPLTPKDHLRGCCSGLSGRQAACLWLCHII